MIDAEKWNELDEEFSRIVDEAKSKWDTNFRDASYYMWIRDRCKDVLERHGLEARIVVERVGQDIIIWHCPIWTYRGEQ
jgi:hypothetical protein